jgi:NADH-quinone oxidoreductase subunit N
MLSVLFLIIISLIIYAITEIRPFLAYTSVLHIIFITITIFMNSINTISVSYFYLFTYLFFIIFLFLILFSFQNNNNIWYFTDLQFFFKNTPIVTSLFIVLVSMAGIPPFLGFFAKISVISLLIFNEEYLLFLLTIISGFFIAYFYIQNYRFFGYNLKNINYTKNLLVFKNNNKLYFYLYMCIYLNIFSLFFVNDFFILSTFISLNF